MVKKDRSKRSRSKSGTSSAKEAFSAISRRGWKVVGGGMATIVVGFILLAFTDPWGQNWASHLSPIVILLGYALIGAGIIVRDPSPPQT